MTNPYATPTEASPKESTLAVHSAGWIVLAAGISLLPFLWIAVSIDQGNPTWWKPFPMIAVFATFMLRSKVLAFLLGSSIVLLCFGVFNWPLLHGGRRLSNWSVLFVPVHGLNGLYLLASYPQGVRHLGREHTVTICAVTFVVFVFLVLLGSLNIWRPSFQSALMFQWLAWLWIILYLFPLLGPLFTLV